MEPGILRRYTSLPVLLDMLQRKKLTLLDFQKWDDKNDSYFMAMYKAKKNLKSVLAVCFSQSATEAYHHWRVFAGNSAGVCIKFDKRELVDSLHGKGLRHDSVDYCEIRKLEETEPQLDRLPFLKRIPYQDEVEFRIIYESKTESLEFRDLTMPVAAVKGVVFNPWIPRSVFRSAKAIIRTIDECKNLQVTKTTVLENERWKAAGEKVQPSKR